jgi:hypothetical protein
VRGAEVLECAVARLLFLEAATVSRLFLKSLVQFVPNLRVLPGGVSARFKRLEFSLVRLSSSVWWPFKVERNAVFHRQRLSAQQNIR